MVSSAKCQVKAEILQPQHGFQCTQILEETEQQVRISASAYRGVIAGEVKKRLFVEGKPYQPTKAP